MHPLTTYISGLIKLFFPESCIICTKLGDLFCQSCQSSVKFSINKKQIFLKNKNYSLKPNKNPHIEIYYSTEYQKIKKILHSIKFNHKKELITFWSKSNDLKKIIDKRWTTLHRLNQKQTLDENEESKSQEHLV